MEIKTTQHFVARNFVVYNFYGQRTCFAWNENELVSFPYSYKDSTEELNVLVAPEPIRNIYCFQERVFVVCKPSAIFKLTQSYRFAGLSQSGISLGSQFSEVLTPIKGYLYLEDKKNKITKQLFKLSSNYSPNDLSVLSFIRGKTDDCLKCLFESNNCNNANGYFAMSDSCIIAYQNNIYLLQNQSVTLRYSCDHTIIDVVSIQKSNKSVGAVFITNTETIYVMHVNENTLRFDKVHLDSRVQTLAAIVKDKNSILIVYSDDSRTYYIKALLNEYSNHIIKTENQSYKKLLILESKYLLCLSDVNTLIQVSIKDLETLEKEESNDFIKLEKLMLNGLEDVVDSICEETRELQNLSIKLMEEEDKLKRINIFANNKRIIFSPEARVQKFLNQKVLITNFQNSLPQNSQVLHILKCDGRILYSIQVVRNNDTVIETPVSSFHLTPSLYLGTNLITYTNEDNGMWCMIRDYVKVPVSYKENKIQLEPKTLSLVQYKLKVLKTLIREDNFDMATLEDIKQRIRKDIVFQ